MNQISMLDKGLSSMFEATSLHELLLALDDKLASEILSCIYHAPEPFLKTIERRMAVTVHKLVNSNISGVHRERVEKILLQLRNRLDFVKQSSTKFSYFHHLLQTTGSISIK